jgi:hypothetical protein
LVKAISGKLRGFGMAGGAFDIGFEDASAKQYLAREAMRLTWAERIQ